MTMSRSLWVVVNWAVGGQSGRDLVPLLYRSTSAEAGDAGYGFDLRAGHGNEAVNTGCECALNYRWLHFIIAQFNHPSQNTQESAMSKQTIHTDDAPKAIGTYSQAVRCGDTVYLAGQIALDPATMQMVDGIEAQIHRVFKNLQAVAKAAGGTLDDCAKVNIYLTDLGHFAKVNEIMAGYFNEPYPARAAVGVASLPRNALVEVDAVMFLK